MRSLVLAALLAASAPALRAAESEPALRLVAVYGGAAALDLGSTEWALATGRAREANPLMRERSVRFAANAGFVAGATWATRRLQASGHPGRARVLKWGFVLTRAVLAVHNVRQARRR